MRENEGKTYVDFKIKLFLYILYEHGLHVISLHILISLQ